MTNGLLISDIIQNFSDEDESVRAEAVSQLIEIGPFSATSIQPLLLSSNDHEVYSAIMVLSAFESKKYAENFIELLNHSNKKVVSNSTKALRKISNSVESILLKDFSLKTSAQKTIILDLIIKNSELKNTDPIILALSEDDSEVRMKAAHALGVHQVKKGIEGLIESLSDSDWRVRLWSVTALGMIGVKRGVVKPLSNMLTDDNIHVKTAVVTSLGDIGAKSVMDKIVPLLDTDDDILRNEVIRSLGLCKQTSVRHRLISMYEKADVYERASILSALGNIGGSGIYSIFDQALTDGDNALLAVYVLRKMNTVKSKEIMEKHLDSNNLTLKNEIVRFL
jgi:HEAT repeat protein